LETQRTLREAGCCIGLRGRRRRLGARRLSRRRWRAVRVRAESERSRLPALWPPDARCSEALGGRPGTTPGGAAIGGGYDSRPRVRGSDRCARGARRAIGLWRGREGNRQCIGASNPQAAVTPFTHALDPPGWGSTTPRRTRAAREPEPVGHARTRAPEGQARRWSSPTKTGVPPPPTDGFAWGERLHKRSRLTSNASPPPLIASE
jgi:hypothetical protein